MGELSKLRNIGKVVEEQLNEVGINTVDELIDIVVKIGATPPTTFLFLDGIYFKKLSFHFCSLINRFYAILECLYCFILIVWR